MSLHTRCSSHREHWSTSEILHHKVKGIPSLWHRAGKTHSLSVIFWNNGSSSQCPPRVTSPVSLSPPQCHCHLPSVTSSVSSPQCHCHPLTVTVIPPVSSPHCHCHPPSVTSLLSPPVSPPQCHPPVTSRTQSSDAPRAPPSAHKGNKGHKRDHPGPGAVHSYAGIILFFLLGENIRLSSCFQLLTGTSLKKYFSKITCFK